MRLRTWLAHNSGRAVDHLSTDWTVVRKIRDQAEAFEREVRAHGVILRVCDDAERFKAIVEKEAERLRLRKPEERPILAPHADPVSRNLSPANFMGLLGQEIGLNKPLFTTNTLSIYRRSTLRALFASQKLFCDYPDTDAPYDFIEVMGDAPELDRADNWCHGGTMWFHPDKRGLGLAPTIAELTVRVGWLRWGSPVFGTVMAGKGHEKKFRAPRVLGTAICQPKTGQAIHTPITLYTADDFLTNDLLSDAIAAAGERI